MGKKVCTKCEEEKELGEFAGRKNRRDGHDSQCKQCKRDNATQWLKNNRNRAIPSEIPATLICSRCFNERGIDEFYISRFSVNGHMGQCKQCRREYGSRNHKIRIKKVKAFRDSLKNVPCAKCKTQYPPYIMQFHHKDPHQKHKGLSQITTIKQMKIEADKCIVMCATCHEITELENRLSNPPNKIIRKRSNIPYRRAETLIGIANLARSVPCLDCGNNFPYGAMHFHHRNREEKLFEIMSSIRLKWIAEDILLSEIEKCVVLCPNCHIEREWGVNGSLRIHFKKKYHSANV